VQKNDWRAVGWASLGVCNIQEPALMCFSGPNEVCVPGLIAGSGADLIRLACAGDGDGPGCSADKAASRG
jgi:hypothetical protein